MSKNKFICDCNVIHEKQVLSAIKNMPSDDTLLKLSKLFKVVGDEMRTKILFILHYHEMCVCDIANVLNSSKSAISHQLRILRENDIVGFCKKGKEVYYSLKDNHIKLLFEIGMDHIGEVEK